MRKTLKRISVVLTLTLLVMVMPTGIVNAADSGAAFYRYFDLSDITQDTEVKTTLPGGSSEPWVWKGTGAVVGTDTQTQSKAWKFNMNAGVYYQFPEVFEAGVVRISFDFKATGTGITLFPRIMSGNDKLYTWAEYGWKNGEDSVIRLNKNGFAENVSWQNASSFVRETWHRIDVVADYTNSTPIIKSYLDGQILENVNSVSLSGVNGIKGLRLDAMRENTGNIWFDNFVFSRFSSPNLMLKNITEQKIGLENGSLKLYLSERVDPALIIKENITIKHKKTGAEVSNFTITPDENGDFFTINFDGTIHAGRYEIMLSSNVIGTLSGLAMTEGYEVRTEPKIVDGVEIPEISEIRVYDYKGDVLTGSNLTSLISKAEVEFNRPIADSGKEKVTITKDGQSVACTKTVASNIMTLAFDKFLDPSANYRITVAEGIAAADSENAVSEDSDSKSFTTQNDAGIVFFAQALSGDSSSYSFKIAKNTDSTAVYTLAVCGYNQQTVGEETLPQLMGMGYKAIDLSETDRGIFDYTITTGFSGVGSTKTFVWKWPSLSNVELDANGKVK